MRQIRFLQGWMTQEEATANHLGRNQLPTDDVAAYHQTWQAARQAVDARTPYNAATPQLEHLPLALNDAREAFLQRPDVIAAFQGLDWSIGIVDLECVLSFQKVIVEDAAEDRVAGIETDDLPALFSACLPDPIKVTSLECAIDPDQKGLTFFSSNPNLRLGGYGMSQIQVPIGPGLPNQTLNVAGFIINLGTRFIQIAEFNSRWFVRDGYHRCFGFLRKGITKVPCVFIRAHSFDELGANQPTFLRPEILFGSTPPFLKDFLSNVVTGSTQHRDIRKIVRVSAQEFLVQL